VVKWEMETTFPAVIIITPERRVVCHANRNADRSTGNRAAPECRGAERRRGYFRQYPDVQANR